MKIESYIGKKFESSSVKTPEFIRFARDLRTAIVAQIKDSEWKLEVYKVGHFDVSGFFYNMASMEYSYFSISDVRFFPNDWYNSILVRKARDKKDFTGGRNFYTPLSNLVSTLDRL